MPYCAFEEVIFAVENPGGFGGFGGERIANEFPGFIFLCQFKQEEDIIGIAYGLQMLFR